MCCFRSLSRYNTTNDRTSEFHFSNGTKRFRKFRYNYFSLKFSVKNKQRLLFQLNEIGIIRYACSQVNNEVSLKVNSVPNSDHLVPLNHLKNYQNNFQTNFPNHRWIEVYEQLYSKIK